MVLKNYLIVRVPEETIEALKRFSRFSEYYCRLAKLDEVEGPFVAQMRRLNQWEVDVAYPFLMAALDHLANGEITEVQFVEVSRMIESFVVRRTVCWVPSNRLRRIFAQMSPHIDFHNFVESSHKYLIDNEWPGDNEFIAALVHFRLYVLSRLFRTRLILSSLERSFGHKETPAMGPNITIEHIMPQTLSQEWKDSLGSEASQIHTKWLDTIGNLTLSGYNPNLGNRPFSEKKRLLLDSNFALSKGLQDYDVWNESAIEKRGRELAERAATIWNR